MHAAYNMTVLFQHSSGSTHLDMILYQQQNDYNYMYSYVMCVFIIILMFRPEILYSLETITYSFPFSHCLRRNLGTTEHKQERF